MIQGLDESVINSPIKLSSSALTPGSDSITRQSKHRPKRQWRQRSSLRHPLAQEPGLKRVTLLRVASLITGQTFCDSDLLRHWPIRATVLAHCRDVAYLFLQQGQVHTQTLWGQVGHCCAFTGTPALVPRLFVLAFARAIRMANDGCFATAAAHACIPLKFNSCNFAQVRNRSKPVGMHPRLIALCPMQIDLAARHQSRFDWLAHFRHSIPCDRQNQVISISDRMN
jgi:hypothetical protein